MNLGEAFGICADSKRQWGESHLSPLDEKVKKNISHHHIPPPKPMPANLILAQKRLEMVLCESIHIILFWLQMPYHCKMTWVGFVEKRIASIEC